jgi:hypothetical protein
VSDIQRHAEGKDALELLEKLSLQKLKIELPYDLANLLLNIYSKGLKSVC